MPEEPQVTTDQSTVTIDMPVATAQPVDASQSQETVQPQETIQVSPPTPEPEPPKHAGGRPCKLCEHLEEFQTKLQAYLDDCRGKNSNKPKIPYLMEFADMIDVDKETIIDWSDKLNEGTKELEHPEFHRMIKACENLQELRCNQRLMGRYNPTGAIFLLKTKHKYIETEKKLLGGDPDNKLEITITEERKLPDGE